MKHWIGKKVLITTSDWFKGNDGVQYKSVFGTLQGIHETKEYYGFTPNRNHANWVVEVGNMVIAGCQVLYCEQVDVISEKVHDWSCSKETEFKVIEYTTPNNTYIVD